MSDCGEGSTGLRQTGSSKIQICLENARETGGRRGGVKTVINCVTVTALYSTFLQEQTVQRKTFPRRPADCVVNR